MCHLVIGCGYLGSRVAAAWRREGHQVFALTRSHTHAEELRATGIEPLIGDVTRPETLGSLPEADTLLYAVGFDRSAGHSQREVYVLGLQNVVKAVGDRVKRFLYVSSTSVYGQSDGEWVDETSPTVPTSRSGQVCLEAEQVVRGAFASNVRKDGPAANVLRLAGIYGPGRLLRRVESLQSGEPIPGNPDGWLNLIHVNDAAAAVLACQRRGEPGATFLVSDDRPLRRREYFERLASLVGADRPVFDAASGKSGLNKRCRNRRMREQLAVGLRYPTFESGLRNAVEGTAS